MRGAVESEAAEEALELEADHASATLRRIIGLTPPGPRFAPYYDAFLKRWVARMCSRMRWREHNAYSGQSERTRPQWHVPRLWLTVDIGSLLRLVLSLLART